MIPSRRHILRIGGGALVGVAIPPLSIAGEPIEIRMQGNALGSQVWFDPVGIRVEPGRAIRWVNLDPGNSHTATAYHPQNFGRPRRIPEGAEPWNSDYLLPNETFSVTLTKPGVYDFYCIPHEHAGMVGRIVVGHPPTPPDLEASGGEPVPEEALRSFPSVEEIIRQGLVRRT